MSIILFLVGLILLFKGEFTFSNRRFSRDRARTAAIFLMIPAAFDLCAGFYIGINLTDGQTMDMNALIEAISNPTLTMIQLLMMIGAVGAAFYWLYSAPANPDSDVRSMPAAPTKDVMTPAEAANYLRVTEPDVIALIDGGHLPAARIAGEYRIARRAVDDYLSSQRAGNPFEDA
jgi:excisionase family DNA binding protein